MQKLNIEKQHSEYDDIPVLYCKQCLSLKIRNVQSIEDSDYCDECSATDIGECSIEEWETLYKNKYGHSYLETY